MEMVRLNDTVIPFNSVSITLPHRQIKIAATTTTTTRVSAQSDVDRPYAIDPLDLPTYTSSLLTDAYQALRAASQQPSFARSGRI
jgi:hypothetical protein